MKNNFENWRRKEKEFPHIHFGPKKSILILCKPFSCNAINFSLLNQCMMMLTVIIDPNYGKVEHCSPIGGEDTGRDWTALFQKNSAARFETSPR